jgi:hypothetical protein
LGHFSIDNAGGTLVDGLYDTQVRVTDSTGASTPAYFLFDLHCAAGPGQCTVQTSVPEPSTWVLLVLGVAGLSVAQRRRRRS